MVKCHLPLQVAVQQRDGWGLVVVLPALARQPPSHRIRLAAVEQQHQWQRLLRHSRPPPCCQPLRRRECPSLICVVKHEEYAVGT